MAISKKLDLKRIKSLNVTVQSHIFNAHEPADSQSGESIQITNLILTKIVYMPPILSPHALVVVQSHDLIFLCFQIGDGSQPEPINKIDE